MRLILEQINKILTFLFAIEVLLKMIATEQFGDDKFNYFDLAIVPQVL